MESSQNMPPKKMDDDVENQDDDSANTFKILIATDLHLGYMEKDPLRMWDTLRTFDEILKIAKAQQVDFILLGGDLFHENKPSRRVIHKTMELLRKYCFGDKPIEFQLLSDQNVNFATSPFPIVNYEDPNLNVAIPVFSIHGNHDDPTGAGNLCPLDELSVCGLVNYFGKITDLENIEISPILLRKGATKLALYGLGAIKDERLNRLFVRQKVKMLRPKDDGESKSWFNLFVIHQNRAKRGHTTYIPEDYLDDFLDLVIWGHEHDCCIDPVINPAQNFFVIQPGSSVATSLSEGETIQKQVGILEIRDKSFKVEKYPLRTVRQFYMEDVCLADTDLNPDDPFVGRNVEQYCQEKVEQLLEKAQREHSGRPNQPKRPLIRLRVDHSGGFEVINVHSFAQKFAERVANPKDIIIFHRKNDKKGKMVGDGEPHDMEGLMRDDVLDTTKVADIVKQYFVSAEQNFKLSVLSDKGLGDSINEFVEKQEKDAIAELVRHQLKKSQQYLNQIASLDEDMVAIELENYREERLAKNEDDNDMLEVLASCRQAAKYSPGARKKDVLDLSDEDGDDSDMNISGDEDQFTPAVKSTSGRGRGHGRGQRGGARGTRGAPTGRRVRAAANTPTLSFAKQTQPSQTSNAGSLPVGSMSDEENPFSLEKLSTSRKKATARKPAFTYED